MIAGDVPVGQSVVDARAGMPARNQPGPAETGQLLGYRGLAAVEFALQLGNALLAWRQRAENLQTSFVRHCLEELDRAVGPMCSELAACAPEGRFPARYFATAATGSRSDVVTMSTLRADIRPIAPGPARLTITAKTVSSGCGPAPENSRMESFFGRSSRSTSCGWAPRSASNTRKRRHVSASAVHRSIILTCDRDANDWPPTSVRSVKQCSYQIIDMCELVFSLLIARMSLPGYITVS